MSDIDTNAYGQWVTINLVNQSQKTIVVKNVRLKWGKFHKDNDKDAEIETSDIENRKIYSGGSFKINACGRANAFSGTEGEFEVYEEASPRISKRISHFYWNCPWGRENNTWTIHERSPNWVVRSDEYSIDGALGNITVEFYHRR